MPGTVEYNGVLYFWNTEKKRIEMVTVVTKPVSLEDCPREVMAKLLEKSDEDK